MSASGAGENVVATVQRSQFIELRVNGSMGMALPTTFVVRPFLLEAD
jgi:hypothetical protein